jgi:hypothetical protein
MVLKENNINDKKLILKILVYKIYKKIYKIIYRIIMFYNIVNSWNFIITQSNFEQSLLNSLNPLNIYTHYT